MGDEGSMTEKKKPGWVDGRLIKGPVAVDFGFLKNGEGYCRWDQDSQNHVFSICSVFPPSVGHFDQVRVVTHGTCVTK